MKCDFQREGESSWISRSKGVAYHECYCKINILLACVLNLFQDSFVSCLKVLVGVGTKVKPLVRSANSSSVNVWSERLYVMFFVILGGI